MELYINPRTGAVTANGRELKTDVFYDLDEHPDHQFVVRSTSRTAVILQIATKREPGKKRRTAQTGRVQLVSATTGQHDMDGNAITQSYTVVLDPEKPIWPIADVVDQLLAAGLKGWQISPMTFNLYTTSAAHSSPQMKTDGTMSSLYDAGDDDTLPGINFTVKDAAWAILHHDGDINHVYLWPTAGDAADSLMRAVNEIQAIVAT